jgi:hypothetical protein
MITGDDYIAVAERLLLSKNAKEADYRSAVSRAYYGAFHLASDFLSSLGFAVPRGAAAHGWIPQALLSAAHPEATDAGRLLRDACCGTSTATASSPITDGTCVRLVIWLTGRRPLRWRITFGHR